MNKAFKKARKKRDEKIARHAADVISRLSDRLRYRERIEKANSWAKSHPKATFGWTVGLLLFSFAVSLCLTLASANGGGRQNPDTLEMGTISDVTPMFDGFHRIQQAKTYQTKQVGSMITDGQRVKHELDSLVSKPYKTHEDSVQIIIRYRQLENIVNTLKHR
jgi:hypothetical protein